MPRGVAPGEEGYVNRVLPEDLPRKVNPLEHGPSPVGAGLERFGDALAAKYEKDSALWAGNQIAQLRVGAVKALEDAKANAPSGDPGNFTEQYLQGFDKSSAPLVEAAQRNPYAGAMVQKGLTDLRTTLAEHSMQWEASQRVAARADSISQNLTSQLPIVEAHPELATQVGSTLMDQINSTGADPSSRLRMAREMHGQLALAAANGMARQDPHGVLSGLDNPEQAPEALRGLTDQQREAVRNRAQTELVTSRAAAITQVYESHGTTAGVRALNAIDQDTSIPDELKPRLRAEVNSQVNQLRDQRREQHAEAIASLESRISTGQAGGAGDRAQARTLFEQGAYSPTQYASTVAGIARSEQSAVDDHANLNAAAAAYKAGSPLDPHDPDVKKGVAQLFTALTEKVAPGSDEYVNRAVDITKKVGVAPEPVISLARTNLVGGDPKSATAAADLIDRLDTANSRAVPFALDEKTKAMAGSINAAVKAGTDPQVAVDMARRNAEASEAQVKELDARWKHNKVDEGQQNALRFRMGNIDEGFKGGWFSSSPALPTPMQAQFDQLTKDYYRLNGGDLTQARDQAARDVSHVWGVSRVNGGPQVMAYAPERMFPGLTVEQIRNDIEHSLPDVDASKVRLVEDPQLTARTSGAQWNLEAPDKNGLMHTILGKDGNPLIYQLPVTKEDYHAVRERERQAQISAVRVEQERRRAAGQTQAEADADRTAAAPEYWGG